MQTLRLMSSSSSVSASSTPKAASKSAAAALTASAAAAATEDTLTSSSYIRVAHVWAALVLLPTMSVGVDELAPLLAATFERLDHIVNASSASASASSASSSSSSSSSSAASSAASARRVFRAPRVDAHALLHFDAAVALRAECARALMRALSNQHALSSATVGALASSSSGAGAAGGALHWRMLSAPFFARFVWPLMQSSSSSAASASFASEAEASTGVGHTSQATANSHPIALRAVLYYFQIACVLAPVSFFSLSQSLRCVS